MKLNIDFFKKSFSIYSLLFFPAFFGIAYIVNHYSGYETNKNLAEVFTRSRVLFSIVFYIFINFYRNSKKSNGN
jgi:hypothetical protein